MGNSTEQLRPLYDAWWGIFDSYPKKQAPEWEPFWSRYRAYVRRGVPIHIGKISAQKLHDKLHGTPDVKAFGLDA